MPPLSLNDTRGVLYAEREEAECYFTDDIVGATSRKCLERPILLAGSGLRGGSGL